MITNISSRLENIGQQSPPKKLSCNIPASNEYNGLLIPGHRIVLPIASADDHFPAVYMQITHNLLQTVVRKTICFDPESGRLFCLAEIIPGIIADTEIKDSFTAALQVNQFLRAAVKINDALVILSLCIRIAEDDPGIWFFTFY